MLIEDRIGHRSVGAHGPQGVDLNADGKLDLVSGCFEGGVYVLFGEGEGKYAEPAKLLDKEGTWLRLGQYWDDEASEWTNTTTSKYSSEHGIAPFRSKYHTKP